MTRTFTKAVRGTYVHKSGFQEVNALLAAGTYAVTKVEIDPDGRALAYFPVGSGTFQIVLKAGEDD